MNSVHTVLNKSTQKIARNGRLFAVYAAHSPYPIQGNGNFIATEATTSSSRGFLHYQTLLKKGVEIKKLEFLSRQGSRFGGQKLNFFQWTYYHGHQYRLAEKRYTHV